MHLTTALFWLSSTTLALQVTSPAKNSKWEASKDQTVIFDSVATDPNVVNVVLVNQHIYPPVSVVAGTQVDISGGTYSIPAETLLELGQGDGYQVNLVSPTNNGILAQSGTFALIVSDSAPIIGPTKAISPDTTSATSDASSSNATGSAGSDTASHADVSSSGIPVAQSTSGLAPTAGSSSEPSTTTNTGSSLLVRSGSFITYLIVPALAALL